MANWFFPLLAGLVGVLAALSAATGVAPLAAFVAGVLLVLIAVARARTGARDDAVGEPPEATPRVQPADGLSANRDLIEALPSALMIISQSGRVLHANRAAHGALPRIEAGAHFAHVIRAPAFVEAVGETLADGAERSFQFMTFEGSERYLDARVAPLPGDDPQAEPQAIVQIEDRTKTHRAEVLRSDFIANASHELRTPLASIIGYIETLQNHARQDPEAREKFLGIMAREAGRMQRLVDDLMWLSRIEMSEHVHPSEEWSLNQVAAESASALLPLAGQQDVRLEIDLGQAEAMVFGDRDQLYQVFTNLVDNAMKYGGAGCTVRVETAGSSKAFPGRHGVSVVDTGPGIPREHVHRLTERFYRVNVSHSRNKGGTGLGLAIVKHILNRHRGRLEITSTPGEGSRFTVWLPRAEDRDASAEPTAAAKSTPVENRPET